MKFFSQKKDLAHLDHSYFFRQGFRSSLRHNPDYDLRISVCTVEKLLSKLKSIKVDVLLLGNYDVAEYPIDSLLVELIKCFPDVSVVAFQNPARFNHINHLIKMGVKCFIPKDCTEDEFYNSLNEVMKEGFYFNGEIKRHLIEKVQREQKLYDLNLALSGIEQQILQLVSNGLTAEEISVKLRKSRKTIDGYRYRMMKKANVKNITELVAWGFRNGSVI